MYLIGSWMVGTQRVKSQNKQTNKPPNNIWAFTHTYMNTSRQTSAFPRTLTHTCAQAGRHLHTHLPAHGHSHTHIHSQASACTQAPMHISLHTCTHACSHRPMTAAPPLLHCQVECCDFTLPCHPYSEPAWLWSHISESKEEGWDSPTPWFLEHGHPPKCRF